MQAAELDSVGLYVAFGHRDYITALADFERQTGLVVVGVRQGKEAVASEMFAEWKSITKRPPTNKAAYLAIAYSIRGLKYPIEVWKRSKGFVIYFNGLMQYKPDKMELTETANNMRDDLKELISADITYKLYSFDVCVDDSKPIKIKAQKRRTINEVGKKNEPTIYHNTKQGKYERYIRAYSYNKQAKSGLFFSLFRFEVCFGSVYCAKSKSVNEIRKSLKKWLKRVPPFSESLNMVIKN